MYILKFTSEEITEIIIALNAKYKDMKKSHEADPHKEDGFWITRMEANRRLRTKILYD